MAGVVNRTRPASGASQMRCKFRWPNIGSLRLLRFFTVREISPYYPQRQRAEVSRRPLHMPGDHNPGREDLLRLHMPPSNALLVGKAQEQFERRTVLLDAVGKVIAAKELLHRCRVLGVPRQSEMAGVTQSLEAALLRGIKGIVEVARDPGIVF